MVASKHRPQPLRRAGLVARESLSRLYLCHATGEVANRVVVLEVKGQHLSGNPDTEYKKAVLRLMGEAYDIEHTSRIGELELMVPDGTTVESDLVLMTEWTMRLPNEFLVG